MEAQASVRPRNFEIQVGSDDRAVWIRFHDKDDPRAKVTTFPMSANRAREFISVLQHHLDRHEQDNESGDRLGWFRRLLG